MKLKQLPVIIGSSLVALGMTSNISQAATLINFSINSSTSSPSALGQCTVTSCDFSKGGISVNTQTFVATNQTAVRFNDAPYAITGIDYLLQGSDASNFTWNPTSSSNIFNVQVLNGGTELSFTGGSIAPGAYYSIARNYNPPSTSSFSPRVTLSYAVPEPSSILGTLFFGAISAGCLLKRKSCKVA